MPEEQKQKYCYLVEHPHQGTKVFYDPYDQGKAAQAAIEYAENLVIVFRTPLYDEPLVAQEPQSLSASFAAAVVSSYQKKVELPLVQPIDALLSSVG